MMCITPRLKGQIPDSLNKFVIVDFFTQSIHADLNMAANVYLVKGIPGLLNL